MQEKVQRAVSDVVHRGRNTQTALRCRLTALDRFGLLILRTGDRRGPGRRRALTPTPRTRASAIHPWVQRAGALHRPTSAKAGDAGHPKSRTRFQRASRRPLEPPSREGSARTRPKSTSLPPLGSRRRRTGRPRPRAAARQRAETDRGAVLQANRQPDDRSRNGVHRPGTGVPAASASMPFNDVPSSAERCPRRCRCAREEQRACHPRPAGYAPLLADDRCRNSRLEVARPMTSCVAPGTPARGTLAGVPGAR